MNNRYKYLIKNVGILTISNFSSKLLSFLLVPLFTSVLSTEEYGMYDIIVSTVQLLLPVLTLNIFDAAMRFYMDKNNEKADIASLALKYLLGSYLVVGIFLLAKYIGGFIPIIDGYELYILLYFISYALYQFIMQFAKGMEQVTDLAVAGIIGTVTMLGLNILFLVVVKWGLSGFYVASICAQFIPALYLVNKTRFWHYIKWVSNKAFEWEMLCYSMPLILTAISWWVNSASDKYVVFFLCGAAANGLLSVAYKIPTIITTLQSIFTQAWQISAIKEYTELSKNNFYSDVFTYLNALMCLACSILIVLSKPLAYFLYAKDFFIAWKYVPFLLVSSVFNSASGFAGPILAAQKNSKAMGKSAIYGVISNIILNIVLIYWIGIQGATIATAIASFIIFVVRDNALGGLLHSEYFKGIIISWILLCCQALAAIYSGLYLNQICILVCIVVTYRKPLFQIFSKGIKLIPKRKS